MPKKNYSGFFVTVNTNFHPKTKAESLEMGEKLRKAMTKMMTEEGLREVVRMMDPNTKFDASHILGIDGELKIEVGKQAGGRRVHAHALIELTHNTRVQLNRTKMSEFIVKEIGDERVTNPHIDIRLTSNTRGKKSIENYMEKADV